MVPNLTISRRNCKQRPPSYFGGPKTYKPGFNIIHFVRMCHYSLIDEYRVFLILNISCSKCKEMGRKCRNTHYNEDNSSSILYALCSKVGVDV